ncbi:MAG: hypothetical protein GEU98_24970 [Pseudonocardiaceae bacterium]|nr:hypothetical protein [Pseudonocardiaceae bacterium]
MHGPPDGLRAGADLGTLFEQLADADGVMVAPGMLPLVERHFVGRRAPSLVLHLDWKNFARATYPPGERGRGEGVLTSLARLDEVAATGADAVMTYLYVGQRDTALEREEIERNARIARECDRLGLALIVEPRSAMEGLEADAASAELGADIVKCIWPGSVEGFATITESSLAPVLLAGGPGGEDTAATLRLAGEALDAGGAGVMFGRRVFRADKPAEVIARLRELVHGGASR